MENKFKSIEHEIIYNKINKYLIDNNSDNKVEQVVFKKELTSNSIDNSLLYEIHQYINIMEKNRKNYAYRNIFSHRKVLGPFIVFTKKLVRKVLKWYIEPFTFQQSDFNSAVTPAIGRTTEIITSHISKIDELTNMYDVSQTQLQNLQSQYEESMLKLSQMEEVISTLTSNFELKQNNNENLIEEIKQKQNNLDLIVDNIDKRQINLDFSINSIHQKQNLIDKSVTSLEKTHSVYADKIEHVTIKLDKLKSLDIFTDNSAEFFNKNTFSQSGEDSILAYIVHVLGIPFEKVDYIDLGANHAKEMSNTYFFYSRGAKGILVEANSNLIPELKFYRHRDIILNYVVDVTDNKEVDFYILNGDGLSTPNYDVAVAFCEKNPSLSIVEKKVVETINYNTIVDQYLGKAPTILSIDIEGKDLEILKSIDMEKNRPTLIVIEMISYDTSLNYHSKNEEITNYMNSIDYDEYAFTGINSIFLDRRYLKKRGVDKG